MINLHLSVVNLKAPIIVIVQTIFLKNFGNFFFVLPSMSGT